MAMTQDEKEKLADRVVVIMRDEDPAARIEELRGSVASGDEGEDGMNSTVLAIAQALFEHLRR